MLTRFSCILQEATGPAVGYDHGHRLWTRTAGMDEMNRRIINDDFMVMGGYGHSRLREFVLGGVTRSILRTMTVPTLMSH